MFRQRSDDRPGIPKEEIEEIKDIKPFTQDCQSTFASVVR